MKRGIIMGLVVFYSAMSFGGELKLDQTKRSVIFLRCVESLKTSTVGDTKGLADAVLECNRAATSMAISGERFSVSTGSYNEITNTSTTPTVGENK